MARYCFYCGKELADEEKCRCREQAYRTGASSKADNFTSQADDQSRKSETSDDSNETHRQSQEYNYKHQSASSQQQQGRYGGTGPYAFRGRTYSGPHRGFSAPLVGLLTSLTAWFKTPADKIRTEALNPKRHKIPLVPIALNFIFLMLWFFLFYHRVAQTITAYNLNLLSPDSGLLLLYAFILVLFFCAIEVFIIWFLLKIMERLAITYIDVLRHSRASFVYLLLFVLLALGGVSAVPMASLAIIIAGFFFAIYVHIRSLVYVYKLSANSQLRLLVFSMVLFTALLTIVERVIPALIKIASIPTTNSIV